MCALKCPPQCSSKCSSKHHPLLLALLNWPEDRGDSSRLDQARVEFTSLVHKYEQFGTWSKDKDIPEDNDLYKFPLLHWAAVLGKISAVKSLLDIGVSSILQTRQLKESALHRAINCLQQTRPKDAFRVLQKLVGLLDATLTVRDSKGNTPLHLSCQYLDTEKAKVDFFIEVIALLAGHAKDKGTASKVLNMKNIDGNTVLHILCRHDRNLPSIRHVVESGAETDVCNNEGLKPLDIAIDCGQLKISQYLDTLPQLSKTGKGRGASASPHSAPANKRRKVDGPQRAADSDSDGSTDRGKSSRGRKPNNPPPSSSSNDSGVMSSKRGSSSTRTSSSSTGHRPSAEPENGDKTQQPVKGKASQDDMPAKSTPGSMTMSSSPAPSTPTATSTPTAKNSTPLLLKSSPATRLALNGLATRSEEPMKTAASPNQSLSSSSSETPPEGWSILLRYLSNFEGTAKKAIIDALVEDEKDCVSTFKSKEQELSDFAVQMEKREAERKAKEQLLIQRLNEIMMIQNEVKQMEVRSSQDQQTLESLQTGLTSLKDKQDSCMAALQATNTMFNAQGSDSPAGTEDKK